MNEECHNLQIFPASYAGEATDNNELYLLVENITNPIKILCVGDLHLGRTSSKCHSSADDCARFAVRECWSRLVDMAIEMKVEIILFTGDINDSNGNIYQTIAPFEKGISRLTAANITVVMIAGNHDARALPHMHAILDNPLVHLLGKNGSWERFDWPNVEKPRISFLGISYPTSGAGKLPLDNLPFLNENNIPVIALAHIDYLSASSDYLWATPSELFAVQQVDCWMLGHIHKPECTRHNATTLLNPGSLQALHPGEPDAHGPWLVEIANGNISTPQQIPFSAVRYDAITLDVSTLQSIEEFSQLIWRSITEVCIAREEDKFPLRYSCRLKLIGQSKMLQPLREQSSQLLETQPFLEDKDIYIDEIYIDEISPEHNIKLLAEGHDIIAAVARMLLDLESISAERATQELLAQVEKQRNTLLRSQPYVAMPAAQLPDKKQLLLTECRRLLDILLRKKEQTS